MARRPDRFAMAAARKAAAELVATWPNEQIVAPGADTRLVSSWGLEPAEARSIVAGERSRRRI